MVKLIGEYVTHNLKRKMMVTFIANFSV
jgi:hypothetical protein